MNYNPITGFEPENISDFANELYEIKKFLRDLRDYEMYLRNEVGKVAAKSEYSSTVYVNLPYGDLKVIYPSQSWDYQSLKKLWENDSAKKYLRIEKIAPNLKEIKKLEKTSGDVVFMDLKNSILMCKKESLCPPTVTFIKNEEIKND